jgi:hypothetical protein
MAIIALKHHCSVVEGNNNLLLTKRPQDQLQKQNAGTQQRGLVPLYVRQPSNMNFGLVQGTNGISVPALFSMGSRTPGAVASPGEIGWLRSNMDNDNTLVSETKPSVLK